MALGRTMTGPAAFCFRLLRALIFWTPVLGDARLLGVFVLPFNSLFTKDEMR